MDENISGQVASIDSVDQAQFSNPREGLIYTWVDGSLGVIDEAVRAYFGFLEDVRTETQERLSATIDLLEGFDRSVFRVARKAVGRLNGVSARALTTSQQGWYALLGTVRRTSQGATVLASETAVSLVGERQATQRLIVSAS